MEYRVVITNDLIKERLNKEIKVSGLTSSEIARRVGVSPTMLTQYRTTKKMPSLETFARICKVIDADANYILGLTDN